LNRRRGETRIRMRGFRVLVGRPVVALPVNRRARAARRPFLPTKRRRRRSARRS
jgi:hypothetical protein